MLTISSKNIGLSKLLENGTRSLINTLGKNYLIILFGKFWLLVIKSLFFRIVDELKAMIFEVGIWGVKAKNALGNRQIDRTTSCTVLFPN